MTLSVKVKHMEMEERCSHQTFVGPWVFSGLRDLPVVSFGLLSLPSSRAVPLLFVVRPLWRRVGLVLSFTFSHAFRRSSQAVSVAIQGVSY